MGVFTRMTDIVQANLNAILDKAEDPEKVLRLVIQEMEEVMVEMRSVAASHLAEQKTVERKLAKLNSEVSQWQQKAELAMSKEREDLARAALLEKHQLQQKVEQLQLGQQEVAEVLTKLQEDTARLQEKLTEAKARQKALAVRQQSAAVRLKVRAKQDSHNIDQAIQRFEHYEQRIDDLEAQVDAYDFVGKEQGLKAQFQALESNEKLEQELAALKKKVA